MDIGDKVPNVDEGYAVTTTKESKNPGPMTRSVFTIAPVDKGAMFGNDDYIRYGQKVRIHANDFLYKKQLTLYSESHKPTVCAPLSGKQIAYMSAARCDANGTWVLDSVDPFTRVEC